MKNTTLILVIGASIVLGTVGFATAENRVPTKGPIPEDAFEGERVNLDKVPDYIPAYARNGEEIAGYIRKTDYFVPKRPKRIEVLDESLSNVVGNLVVNRGFVPRGVPDEAVPEFEIRPLTAEEIKAEAERLPSQN